MCLHLKADHALITIITTIIKIVIIYLTILTPRKSLINNLTLSDLLALINENRLFIIKMATFALLDTVVVIFDSMDNVTTC